MPPERFSYKKLGIILVAILIDFIGLFGFLMIFSNTVWIEWTGAEIFIIYLFYLIILH